MLSRRTTSFHRTASLSVLQFTTAWLPAKILKAEHLQQLGNFSLILSSSASTVTTSPAPEHTSKNLILHLCTYDQNNRDRSRPLRPNVTFKSSMNVDPNSPSEIASRIIDRNERIDVERLRQHLWCSTDYSQSDFVEAILRGIVALFNATRNTFMSRARDYPQGNAYTSAVHLNNKWWHLRETHPDFETTQTMRREWLLSISRPDLIDTFIKVFHDLSLCTTKIGVHNLVHSMFPDPSY